MLHKQVRIIFSIQVKFNFNQPLKASFFLTEHQTFSPLLGITKPKECVSERIQSITVQDTQNSDRKDIISLIEMQLQMIKKHRV